MEIVIASTFSCASNAKWLKPPSINVEFSFDAPLLYGSKPGEKSPLRDIVETQFRKEIASAIDTAKQKAEDEMKAAIEATEEQWAKVRTREAKRLQDELRNGDIDARQYDNEIGSLPKKLEEFVDTVNKTLKNVITGRYVAEVQKAVAPTAQKILDAILKKYSKGKSAIKSAKIKAALKITLFVGLTLLTGLLTVGAAAGAAAATGVTFGAAAPTFIAAAGAFVAFLASATALVATIRSEIKNRRATRKKTLTELEAAVKKLAADLHKERAEAADVIVGTRGSQGAAFKAGIRQTEGQRKAIRTSADKVRAIAFDEAKRHESWLAKLKENTMAIQKFEDKLLDQKNLPDQKLIADLKKKIDPLKKQNEILRGAMEGAESYIANHIRAADAAEKLADGEDTGIDDCHRWLQNLGKFVAKVDEVMSNVEKQVQDLGKGLQSAGGSAEKLVIAINKK